MMRLFRVILSACLALVCSCGFALEGTTMPLTQAQELFRAGNTAYQQQQFEQARNSYVQIAEAGVQSPEVFYNLGNACARLNRTAEAVLYFTRARELQPHNADILANLRRVAPPNVVASLSSSHPIRWIENRLSVREWIGIFLLLYLLTGIAGATFLSLRRPRPAFARYALNLLASFGVIALLFAASAYHQAHHVQLAVLGKPNLSVRSGPADTFAQVDTLAEGEIVKQLGSVEEGWSHIQLPDGRKGYVPNGSLLLI